ncbi:MAG: type II toxin-antitoxin system YoeB family toxin [Alphaproteobacteria bacterium]|nr:type II toxin-antitoxin system YoeB family toxin [Alphaproteobacteria bacterium]
MFKKVYFFIVLSCLFFKSVDCFATIYDVDDTDIIINDNENPFADTRFCGFEKFKEWFGFNAKKKNNIDAENLEHLKNAVSLYMKYKTSNEKALLYDATCLLKDGAQNGCPKSMQWLADLKVEQGDNAPDEEKEKFYNDAFSWYIISFWMQIIKEVYINQEITLPLPIISKLETLIKKHKFSKNRLNHFNEIKTKMICFPLTLFSHEKKNFYSRLSFICYHICLNYKNNNFFADKKLSIFVYNFLEWVYTEGDQGLKIKCESYFQEFALIFRKNKFINESNYFYRNPPLSHEESVCNLAKAIMNNQRNIDQNGRKFREQDRNKIGSKLLWKTNSVTLKQHIIHLIDQNVIRTDVDGKNITNKYELMLKLCLEIKTPYALDRIGMLICDNHINTINKKNITKNEKFNLAADYFRKSKDPNAMFNLGTLIGEKNVDKDENNQFIPIDQRFEVAANLYRKSIIGNPLADSAPLCKLATLIREGKIKTDLHNKLIPEGERYEVAANLYRQSKYEPSSLSYLGWLIHQGLIKKDLNGLDIPQGQEYEIAANLYEQSKIVPFSLFRFGHLIFTGLIKKDMEGIDVLEEEKYEVAARYFRQSKSEPESVYILGQLIENEIIKKDLKGQEIPKGQHYEVAANLYRKYKNELSLYSLANLIFIGKISTDFNNNPIASEADKNKIMIDLLLKSDTPDAYYLIALVKLKPLKERQIEARKDAVEVIKEAMDYFMKASMGGVKDATSCYEILKNELSHILLDDTNQSHEIIFEENKTVDNTDNNDKNKTNTENQQLNNKQSSLKTTTDASLDEPYEGLSLLQRKELKALKKKQREKNNKDQKNLFRKFITDQILQHEKRFLVSPSKKNIYSFSDMKIKFDIRAQNQWVQLNEYERHKVSELIADIKIGGNLGRVEKLKDCGLFSRKITKSDRLIYQIESNGDVNVLSCKGHYND